MKHILFIVTSTDKTGTQKHGAGYEFSEIADPYVEFINQGYTVDFASINGGTPPYVGYNSSEENSKDFKEGNGFKRLNFSHQLSDVDTTAYDAIFFPGGLGLMIDMVDNPLVKEIIKQVYESERVVGAVCHGPTALLNVELSNGKKLLDGKKVNSYTEAEEDLENYKVGEKIPFLLDEAMKKEGALFSSGSPFESYVVTDGNLVTGQNPASASGVAIEMMNKIANS